MAQRSLGERALWPCGGGNRPDFPGWKSLAILHLLEGEG
jgi:hypothetical protein